MGVYAMIKKLEINMGVEQYRRTNPAILLDVRSWEEYAGGHIDDAVNLPLPDLEKIVYQFTDKTVPVFVYCRSGVRSATAAQTLQNLGYQDIRDIGGIIHYHGEIVTEE